MENVMGNEVPRPLVHLERNMPQQYYIEQSLLRLMGLQNRALTIREGTNRIDGIVAVHSSVKTMFESPTFTLKK